jgi:hypothetical protein
MSCAATVSWLRPASNAPAIQSDAHKSVSNCSAALHHLQVVCALLKVLNLPYSPVIPHMGHEMGAGAYPSEGEHSLRMLMPPTPLFSVFNGLSTHCLILGICNQFLRFSVA